MASFIEVDENLIGELLERLETNANAVTDLQTEIKELYTVLDRRRLTEAALLDAWKAEREARIVAA